MTEKNASVEQSAENMLETLTEIVNEVENRDNENVSFIDKSEINAFTMTDDVPLSADEIVAIMTDADDVETIDVDYMVEYLTSKEIDPIRREKFFEYVTNLDEKSLKALWESFKQSYGPTIKQIDLTRVVASHIENVNSSKSLKLRNESVQAELQRFGTLWQQIARAFRSDLSDTPLKSFRVDNTTTYIQNLHRDITTLNSAIIGMAEMLLVDETSDDNADVAINIDRAVRICSIVGYSAKGWAKVHENALKTETALKAEIARLNEQLKASRELVSDTLVSVNIERERLKSMTINAGSYYINNHSGNFLTTKNDPTEDYFRVTPFNLTITQDRNEALVFDDIEDARAVFDAVQEWAKRNDMVKAMFADFGVIAKTLFISAETIAKVEG